jgi:hypothetical protein
MVISKMNCVWFLIMALAVSACGTVLQPSCSPPLTTEVVYVVGHDWHVEIGIPVTELDENMAFFRDIFPGARFIMFSYGKKTFFVAPVATLNEYLLGPFPGPALLQVIGLSVDPTQAYPTAQTFTLRLPVNGGNTLSAFIWKELTKDPFGQPQLVALSIQPEGLFYAAQSEYNLLHTCNTWAADGLASAGFVLSGDPIIFSNQVLSRVAEIAAAQCPVLR